MSRGNFHASNRAGGRWTGEAVSDMARAEQGSPDVFWSDLVACMPIGSQLSDPGSKHSLSDFVGFRLDEVGPHLSPNFN